MLYLFHICDGEDWWIAAESAECALQYAHQIDIDEGNELTVEDIEPALDGQSEFKVFLPDFHPTDLDDDEYPKRPEQNENGCWFCIATVDEWLATCKSGSLVASSLY